MAEPTQSKKKRVRKFADGTPVCLKSNRSIVGEVCETAMAGIQVYWVNHPTKTRCWHMKSDLAVITEEEYKKVPPRPIQWKTTQMVLDGMRAFEQFMGLDP